MFRCPVKVITVRYFVLDVFWFACRLSLPMSSSALRYPFRLTSPWAMNNDVINGSGVDLLNARHQPRPRLIRLNGRKWICSRIDWHTMFCVLKGVGWERGVGVRPLWLNVTLISIYYYNGLSYHFVTVGWECSGNVCQTKTVINLIAIEIEINRFVSYIFFRTSDKILIDQGFDQYIQMNNWWALGIMDNTTYISF